MFKILTLTTSYPRYEDDDAGIFVKRLVDALAVEGHEVEVSIPHDRGEPLVETKGSVQIERFKYGVLFRGALAFGNGIVPNLRKNPLLILQAPGLLLGFVLKAFRTRSSCDLIHANWIFCGLAAWLSHLVTKKPYVLTLRGEDMRLLQSKIFRPFFLRALRSAAAITSVNRSFLNDLRTTFKVDNEKIRCIPNGVHLDPITEEAHKEFLNRTGLDPNLKYLLFIGTVIPRKRIELLIELLSRSDMTNYKLIVCGRVSDKRYHKNLERQAESHGSAERIDFRGQVSPKDVPHYFALSRYYITASEFEGRPNSVLEAFAAGVPVFASSIDAHLEIVRHRESGFIFDADDPKKLAELIKEVEADTKLQDTVVDHGKHIALSHSWQVTAQQFTKAFLEIV